MLIDATLEGGFPADLAAEARIHGARALIWEELGLPALKPEAPWFGYSLGDWPDEFDAAAQRAVAGDAFVTGAIMAQQRRKDVKINTEMRDLDGPGETED